MKSKKNNKKLITKKKFSDYINDIKEHRFEIQGALRKRDEKKIFSKQENGEGHAFDIAHEIKEFNKKFKKNILLYNNLRDENDKFLKKYKIAKIFKMRNRPEGQLASSFQLTFVDLITKYKEKNYKVPDLSRKNNLFEPSPLLMENNKIVDYFRFGDLNKIYEKDLSFLIKTNNQLYEKPETGDLKKNYFSKKTITKIKEEDTKAKQKTIDEYITCIKNNDQYIKRATKLLDENDFKNIFDDKKPESANTSREPKKTRELILGKPKEEKPKKERLKRPNFLPHVTTKHKTTIEKNMYNDRSRELTQYSTLTTDHSLHRDFTVISSNVEKRNNNFILTRGETEINNFLDKEEEKSYNKTKEQIYEEINNKLEEKHKKIKNLENTFDKIISEREPQIQMIFDYYEREYGKDKKIIEENYHKKLEPSDIMKFIQEMKNKVNSLDIYETYQNFVSKLGNFDHNQKDYLKIKELDNKINKMDLELVKKLNKIQKIHY